jgi:hypothetical protein
MEFIVVPEVAIPVMAVTSLVVTPVKPVVRLVLERHAVSVAVVVVATVRAVVVPPLIISGALVFTWTIITSTTISFLLEQVARSTRSLIEVMVLRLFRLKQDMRKY